MVPVPTLHESSLPRGQYIIKLFGVFPTTLQMELDFVGHNISSFLQLCVPLQFTTKLFAFSAYILDLPPNPRFGMTSTVQSLLSAQENFTLLLHPDLQVRLV